MSMNLNLRVKGENVDLYQTPTGVSYACVKPIGSKKPSAMETLARYETWLMGVHKGDENLRTQFIAHIDNLEKTISDNKRKSEFFVR